MNYQTMPFGKYKGWRIDDIPTNYICYALMEFDLPPELRATMFNQMVDNLKCLEYLNESEITSQQVKDTYRKLSLKYHPDKGGSNDAMSAISEFKEALI